VPIKEKAGNDPHVSCFFLLKQTAEGWVGSGHRSSGYFFAHFLAVIADRLKVALPALENAWVTVENGLNGRTDLRHWRAANVRTHFRWE